MKINRISLTVLCLIGLSVPCLAADTPPAWLQAAAAQQLPAYDKDVPAVVLWDEATATFNNKGELTKRLRFAIKVLTREGKELAGRTARYNSESKIEDFIGWHIAPDGKVRKADKKEIVDATVFGENELYSDARQKILVFTEAQPGSVVGWEWEMRETPYVFQDGWSFQGMYLPVMLSRYTLVLPPGWEARGQMVNHEPVEPTGSGNTFTWELRGLSPIKEEPSMPSLHNLAPWLVASVFPPKAQTGVNRGIGSWHDLSRWYDDLAAGQVQLDDAITAKARELTAGQATPLDKTRAIAQWMQKNIRYVAIEIGIGGHKPHASPSVFRNSYGDCKDKVTLMRSLLKAAGINSYFVPIYSGDRHFVQPQVIADQFNHVIVAVALDEALPSTLNHPQFGKLLFFDPTDDLTPVGDLPYYLQGSYGLLVKGSEGDLIRLPETSESANKNEREIALRVDAAGSIAALVARTLSGQMGQYHRRRFHSMGPEKYRQWLEQVIASDVPGVHLKSVKLNNAEDPEKPFGLSYEIQAGSYGKQMGNLLLLRPLLLGRSEELNFLADKRAHPITHQMNESHEDTVRIELPPGYKVDELPDAEKLETDFGRFETSYKVEGQALTFRRLLSLKAVRVPKERYVELKKFYDRVYSSDQASVVLTR